MLHSIYLVGNAAALARRQIETAVLDRTRGGCRTLVPCLHVVGEEVSPRMGRVDVANVVVSLLAGACVIVKRGNIAAVERLNDNVRHLSRGHLLQRWAEGCIRAPHILKVVLTHHSGGVGEFDEVVEELLTPLDIGFPTEQVVQVEVTKGAVELEVAHLEQRGTAGDITEATHFLAVDEQLHR